MDPVVHFEMPAKDRDRMSDFYAKAFGWVAHKYGEEMGNYVVVHTADTDENGMIQQKGAINGGLFPVKESDPPQYPSVVISVDDIHASVKKIQEAGGKVNGEPMKIPGIGLYVQFTDTEGNVSSILQPEMR